MVRSAGSSRKSRSSAACTSVPFVIHGDGGSGSRSIVANRNASAQSVKAATFDGDSVRGGSNGMSPLWGQGGATDREPAPDWTATVAGSEGKADVGVPNRALTR